jgi:hypothetical protein
MLRPEPTSTGAMLVTTSEAPNAFAKAAPRCTARPAASVAS